MRCVSTILETLLKIPQKRSNFAQHIFLLLLKHAVMSARQLDQVRTRDRSEYLDL
jgi:hypothetical protein